LCRTYDIEDTNAFGMTGVLGASIRPGGGSWMDDSSIDARVTVSPGRSSYSRTFRVPPGAPGGAYEVWQSLLDDALKRSYGKLIQNGLTVNGTQASAPSSNGSPADAVRRHYQALGAHDFQTAWNLLSPRSEER